MATIQPNKPFDDGAGVLLRQDCHLGPHQFLYNTYKQALFISNGDTLPITVTLKGDGVTTSYCQNYGYIDVSFGIQIPLDPGESAFIDTRIRGKYFGDNGNAVDVTITGTTTANKSFIWLVEG